MRSRNQGIAKSKNKMDVSQKSEERLRSIFAASPDTITVTDLKGTIVDCNKAALEMYDGNSKQDLIGKYAFDLIAKKDRKKAKEDMKRSLKQGSLRNAEYMLLRKNGAEYPAELSRSIVRDVSGKPTAFVAIVKDITERKKAEMILCESQQKFERLFMRNPEAAIYADAKWHIIDINPRFTQLFGYTKDEVKGKRTTDLLVPKNKKQESAMLGRKSKTGYTYYETARKRKDGSLVPVSISVAPVKVDRHLVGYVGLYKDITERKKAEKALSESEKRYRSVVDNVGIGVSVISPKMEIISLNKQMKKWFPSLDVSKKPICYKSFNNPPRKRVCSYCPTLKTLKDGRVHESITNTPSGDKIANYRIVSSPIKDKDGKIIAAVEVVEDVTERRRMEKQLKSYSERLEELVEERTRKLQESEERFRSVADYASDAIATMDIRGTIIFWNKAAEDIFGYSADEAIGKPIMFITPTRLKKSQQIAIRRIISTGKKGSLDKLFEVVGRKKDGSEFPIELSFSVWKTKQQTFLTGIIRDITERKKAEENLIESQRKLKAQYKGIPIPTYTWQRVKKDFVLVDYNDAAMTITHGYVAKCIGRKASEMYKDRPEIRRELLRSFVEKTSIKREMSYQFMSTDETKHLAVSYGFIPPDLVLVHTEDITERKKVEEERKHHEERLAALNSYSGKLNAARNLKQIYKLTLDAMEQTLGFENAVFLIVKKSNLEVVCHRGHEKPIIVKLPLDGTRKGVTTKAANSREPILVSDVSKDSDYVEGFSGIKSELAVPIIAEDEVLGVLNVESRKLGAFDDKDTALAQILASHAATAMSNLAKREEIEKRINQQASLMRSSAEMIHSTGLRQRLQAILDAIQGLGWRRVVLSVRDENLDIAKPEDIVTAGLTGEEREFLWTNKQPGQVWAERFGPSYARFRIGEFYYLPWSDPFVRKKFSQGTVESHLSPEEMVDWNPDDLLYAPLRLADGRIVGVVSMDDPVDGRRPNSESLAPLELFLHQAAVAIENARLIKQLNDANAQIQDYASKLEVKVVERTRELIDAQNKLLKAERLAAIGQLAGMVGHDLRNPLTGIAGATYYLKTKYGSKMEEKGKEMLRIIEKDIEYSNKIISDLLDYSKELHLEFTESTVDSIVKEAVAQVKVPKNVKISNLTQDALTIKVDKEKMKRVFVNIIKNAIDAMPKGGALKITCKALDGNVEIAFRDTGEGIKKDIMEKLWSPFFTTKAKGMGLGLPICKRIIEAHGGKISVESKLDKGTTFTITFPVKPSLEGGEKVWVNIPESLLSTTTKA
jgi:PAS domain S-box-containing protein